MKIRLGTRGSKLAMWQAHRVQSLLSDAGHAVELVEVKTEGDQILDKPLYALGGGGVFTKALDEALLRGEIDIAVHSYKDYPTQFPRGIALAAVPERASPQDVFVHPDGRSAEAFARQEAVIATSSPRRQAQWLARYPHHSITDVRGNVQTRLRKLRENGWQGMIMAAAGLGRMGYEELLHHPLSWMLPAPAQGALMVACRANDRETAAAVAPIHDAEVGEATKIERQFLNKLEGGCSAPIGALVEIRREDIHFRGNLCMPDGSQRVQVSLTTQRRYAADLARMAVDEALRKGGDEIMAHIRAYGHGQ
jgi:hydroxymethylbilane synthase